MTDTATMESRNMYEDLVRRLNAYSAEYECHGGITAEAADAIEKLIEVIKNHDFLESLIKPCWISVTERLPEKNQIVVAHAGKGTWDFGMFRGISSSGNQEYWHWKGNTLKRVKWWMPKDGALPEPPKEENGKSET